MKKIQLTYIQTIALGFLIIIFIGGALLSLPISSRSGEFTPFVDALFTAASATCVTGLVVYDTYLYWSIFGQIVILILIQIGGLGFMTVATWFSIFLRRKIGLKERDLMREASNSMYIGGIVRLTRHIVFGTIFFEVLGAFILFFRFYPEMGVLPGIFNAIFHAVSAFCNAGFDLMGRFSSFSSLTRYSGDVVVNLVIMSLIVIGGIGFLVWEDVGTHRHHFRQYHLHSKIVLTITGILITVPAILIFLMERGASFADMTLIDSIMASLFQSITPRTAGFNTVSLNALQDSTILLITMLMAIGGSPGSTAGGMKTTTFMVLFLSAVAVIRRKGDLNIFNRRLEDDVLTRSCAIFIIYLSVMLGSVMFIGIIESMPLKELLFEVVSALSTVGLTLGVTVDFSVASKLILSFLMYFGRVGTLTMALILVTKKEVVPVRLPVEKITIG